MNAFIRNLPSCICFAGAIYLLAIGVTTGWGWLILAGLLCCETEIVKFGDK